MKPIAKYTLGTICLAMIAYPTIQWLQKPHTNRCHGHGEYSSESATIINEVQLPKEKLKNAHLTVAESRVTA